MYDNNRYVKKISKYIVLFCALLAFVLLIRNTVPAGESKYKLSEIFLAQPVFAQQGTAFPSDEAGISAYVNVGRSIDLAKAKSALRGVAAEGNNYVIGIMELPGLPEEEFPHMYISSDGWILAYYSKFASASRIVQWYQYEGGTITTTLQDAIFRLCATIGVNYALVKDSTGYYDFKHPEATKLVLAVDTTNLHGEDSFQFSVPYGVTVYEASWSHYAYDLWYDLYGCSSYLKIDEKEINNLHGESKGKGTFVKCDYVVGDILPDKSHVVSIKLYYPNKSEKCWTGAAIVFVYR